MTDCEARVTAIRGRLEDPALYATSEGAQEAHRLGLDLEEARARLESALAEWETASGTMEKA